MVKPFLLLPEEPPKLGIQDPQTAINIQMNQLRQQMADRNNKNDYLFSGAGLGAAQINDTDNLGAMILKVSMGLNKGNADWINKQDEFTKGLINHYQSLDRLKQGLNIRNQFQIDAEDRKQGALDNQRDVALANMAGQQAVIQDRQKMGLPVNNVVSTGGEKIGERFVLPEGHTLPKSDVSKIRDIDKQYDIVAKAVDNYKARLDELGGPRYAPGAFGYEFTHGPEGKSLDAAHGELIVEMKNLFELGALQAPDIAILERFLSDPNSITAQRLGKDGLVAQLKRVVEKVNESKASVANSYGLVDLGVQKELSAQNEGSSNFKTKYGLE